MYINKKIRNLQIKRNATPTPYIITKFEDNDPVKILLQARGFLL